MSLSLGSITGLYSILVKGKLINARSRNSECQQLNKSDGKNVAAEVERCKKRIRNVLKIFDNH